MSTLIVMKSTCQKTGYTKARTDALDEKNKNSRRYRIPPVCAGMPL